MLAQRTKKLKASPTLKLLARARELSAQGNDVIALTVGEPDWETFAPVAKAGIEAIEKGITKYTPASGSVELRTAIIQQAKKDFNIEYSLKEATVASGAKFIIFAALQVLCDEGDEVIIGAPYWVSYPTMIELAGAVPVSIQCGVEHSYKLTADLLEKAITPKTKIFLYCSPSNPTGLAYTKKELMDIAAVLKKYPKIIVISDDMYNRLMLNGEELSPHILQQSPELRDRVIAVNGGSKAYSMTGWRIGWAVGPENIINAMADYQSQATGSASSISQYAAVVAIKESAELIKQVNLKLKFRCDEAIKHFSKIPNIQIVQPDGAFYLWINIEKCLGKKFEDQVVTNSKIFCDILLEKYFLSIVPGNECGVEGFVRLSFAAREELLQKAAVRMDDFISKLK